jgi:hypothetical protein
VERASKTYAWLAGVHTRNWNHCGNDVAWTLLVLLSLAAKILGEDDDGGEMLDEFVKGALLDDRTRKEMDKAAEPKVKIEIPEDWADNLVGVEEV